MLLLSVILLQSCAGRIKTVAVPSLMQKVDYEGTVISEKKHTVTLAHYTEFKHVKHKIIFNLLVRNMGRKPLSINNENISMEFRGKDAVIAPKKLEIQPIDDFMKDLEKDYFNADTRIITKILRHTELTASMIEMLSDDESGIDATKTMANSYLSRLLSSVDDLEETIRIYEQLEEIVPPLVFKPQTIMPARNVTGLIVYDTGDIDEKAEGEFNIVIRVEGEEHRFIFSRSM